MSASHSVGPRALPPKSPKRRNSGNNPPALQVRTAKPKAPSLSHVINHINESPKPELKSFLSMDSAITPKASTSSGRISVAASTMSMYNIELPPLRMDGLMENRGRGGDYEPSPSSASSYTLTPTLTAATAMTTPSSASTLKDHDEDAPPSPGSSRPSSRASSVASSDVVLTPTSTSNANTNAPWDLKSGWRDSVAVTRALDDLDQLHRTLGDEDEDEEEEGFLDEVDQWLAYISKRIRQLEKRHKRLKTSEKGQVAGDVWSIRQTDERYSGVLASGVYHFR
ncbi:hypothetical protein FA13DRAFT_1464428 [Coprinellus micaceus]|uniref:Uncharacterized protein n=1 Tax=Coprinellus micaceus TaxID=71717 RepID=A0A4Y7SMD8_COPMI|nr:hypothetical protein FA13DRAFT_1464428 [Coprinellus micaceus]